MSSTANRVIKNTGFLYAKMGITMFISLYTTRLILNSLGASDFGIYNIVGGSIALLGFLNSAMASASQRFMSYTEGQGDQEKLKNIFNISFVIHTAISLFAILAFIVAGYFFFNGILNLPAGRTQAAIIVYGSMIISTAFSMMSVPYEAVMNAHENMKYYSLIGIFESCLKLLIAYITVYTPIDKLVVYGILMALIPLISLTIMRIYCHRKYPECIIAPKKYFRKDLMKEMTSFAGWGFCSSTSALLTMQGMAILLNMFGGVIANSAHGIANQLSGQLMVFSNNMLKALNPVLVKSQGAGDTSKMLKAASTGNKLSFLIYTFFAIPFIVECPFILKIWLKNIPDYAILFVRLVLIRQMITQMMVTLETCISATGKIAKFTMCSSIIWLSPLIISYILYKHNYPIETIYIVLIFTAFIRIINALYFCKILCKLNPASYITGTFIPCIIQGFTMFFILYLIQIIIKDTSWARLFITIALTIIIHPLFAYYISLNKSEKEIVNAGIKKIKSKLHVI